jgi:site-specific recombinase XerD
MGPPASVTTPPLDRAVDEFLDWCSLERDRSVGTVLEYRRDLRRFTAFADLRHPGITVGEVDRDLVRAFQKDLSGGRTQQGGGATS